MEAYVATVAGLSSEEPTREPRNPNSNANQVNILFT
jgi:hypothetical protein